MVAKKKQKLTLLTNFFVDCAEASTLVLRETSKEGLAKLKRDEVRTAHSDELGSTVEAAAAAVAAAVAVADDVVAATAAELPLFPLLEPLPPSQLGRCGGLLEPRGPLTRPRPLVATASPRKRAPRARVGIMFF